MIRRCIEFLRIILALTAISCLLSTMVTFMGGHRGGADMTSLLLLQLVSIPVSIFLIGAALIYVRRHSTSGSAFRTLWNGLPQWLLFVFFFLNSLVLIGEIALYIASGIQDVTQNWQMHIPLVCMLTSSLAFLMLYAVSHHEAGTPPAMSGRWSG